MAIFYSAAATVAFVKLGVIVFALVLLWRVTRAVERMAAYMEQNQGGRNGPPDRQ